jgi:integrase
MRRGEVVGLRSAEVDLDAGKLRIRQQIQRVQGSLRAGPVETRASNRDLPIPDLAHDNLLTRRA